MVVSAGLHIVALLPSVFSPLPNVRALARRRRAIRLFVHGINTTLLAARGGFCPLTLKFGALGSWQAALLVREGRVLPGCGPALHLGPQVVVEPYLVVGQATIQAQARSRNIFPLARYSCLNAEH